MNIPTKVAGKSILFILLKMRLVSFLTLLVSFVLAGKLAAQDFRAAVVKVDITPDNPQMLLGYQARQSTGVHDKIYSSNCCFG